MSEPAPESIERYIEEQRALVDGELERLLPPAAEFPAVIHQAMRYSVFAGGKRLRPILCLESGRLFVAQDGLLPFAAAIELIHTYSLIHDDLPALDNDDFRRGKPTCHRAFDEATAILAGDALLTLAFEILSSCGRVSDARRILVIGDLSHAIGTRAGMVAGQVVDLETTGRPTDARTLEFIHSAKTGSLIRAAARAGALYVGAPDDDLARITLYGERVGLAFQIVDDLLDVFGSKESLGKTAGKDGRQRKATYPALHGVAESRRIAERLASEACEALEPYGPRAAKLCQIARYLIARKS